MNRTVIMIYPERSAGIMLNPGKGFSLTWNITDTAAERVNLFTATVNPVSFLTVKGGYCRENSSFSASIGIMAKKLSCFIRIKVSSISGVYPFNRNYVYCRTAH